MNKLLTVNEINNLTMNFNPFSDYFETNGVKHTFHWTEINKFGYFRLVFDEQDDLLVNNDLVTVNFAIVS